MRIFLYLSLTLFFFGCKPQKANKKIAPLKVEEKFKHPVLIPDIAALYQNFKAGAKSMNALEENAIIESISNETSDIYRHPSGVYYTLLEEGKGEKLASTREKISAHYTGYLMDGTPFDSSYNRGRPIRFRIGEMIKGWNVVLPHLRYGTKVKLFIPSRLAYGEAGLEGYVPPNSILIFKVKIEEEG